MKLLLVAICLLPVCLAKEPSKISCNAVIALIKSEELLREKAVTEKKYFLVIMRTNNLMRLLSMKKEVCSPNVEIIKQINIQEDVYLQLIKIYASRLQK